MQTLLILPYHKKKADLDGPLSNKIIIEQ